MKFYIMVLMIASATTSFGENIELVEYESDFCAGKVLNPEHCQNDGLCIHTKKKPYYPKKGIKLGLSGHAIIGFDTNNYGCTINHTVLSSYPITEFGIAAQKAISNYRYSGASKGLEVKIEFNFED